MRLRRPARPDAAQQHDWLLRLATLCEAGIPLARALLVLQGTLPPTQRALWQRVSASLEQGQPLSRALRQEDCFLARDLALIALAEQTGRLDRCLRQLAGRLGERLALQRQLRQTLRYPLVVLAGALLVSGFLMVKVVPGFASLYAQFGAQLPWLTQALLTGSGLLRRALPWLLPLAAGLVVALRQGWRRYPGWRRHGHDLAWRLPLLGDLQRDLWLGLWHRTLADMLAAGLPYLDSLDTAAALVADSPLRHAQPALHAAVSAGHPLSRALHAERAYPPLCHQLVAIGEESGQLAALLDELAGQFEQSLAARCAQLLKLLEPALMAFLGLLVGTLVMALYLPLFQLGQVL